MMMRNCSTSCLVAFNNETYTSEPTLTAWMDGGELNEDNGRSPYIAGVMMVLVLLGNGLVILSVYLNPHLKEWTYYFVVNLAVSDLSTVLCCVCGIIITAARQMVASGIGCAAAYGIYIFSTTSSTYALLIISTDRFLRICWPLHHGNLLTPSRAMAAIVLNWIMALIATLIPFLIPQTYQMEGLCSVEKLWPLSYVLFILMVVYLIPVLSIFAMYFKIATVVIRHRREIRALNPQPLSSVSSIEGTRAGEGAARVSPGVGCSRQMERDPATQRAPHKTGGGWKMTKMVLIVSGYYTLSWLPFFVNLLWLATFGHSNPTLSTMGWALPVMNSVINPVIYALRIPLFRQTFCLILRGRCWSLHT